ncbi:MFS transporter [uncultured Alsobacter sp.]|uniref:MFS transporter n=1 Tax=uncultured Alsobacter sp. TaxID=1748258 RepID=UPI0025FEA3A0|nr:MFS transporter [uncultured Alsobacter sp.]
MPRGSGFAPPGRAALLSALLVTLGANTYQLGTGILGALVPFRLALESPGAALAGFVTSAYSVGFVVGTLLTPETVRRLSARRVMTVASLVAATMSLGLALVPAGAGWTALRVVSGLAAGHYMTILEAWIADRAPPGRAGLVFSTYMVLSRLVFGLGQLLIALADPRGLALLAAASCAYLLAPFVPTAVREPPPAIGARAMSGLLDLPRQAPVAAFGSFVHAAVTVTAVSLFPVWGLARGLSVERIAVTLVAIQAGGIVFQILVGPLSDRLDRRIVMAATSTAGAALALAAPLTPGMAQLPAALLTGAWVGCTFVLYALAAAYMTDIARPDQRMAWSSSLMLFWGSGSVLGPVVGALAMDHLGPDALFGFIGLVNAAYAIYLVVHRLRQ